MSQGVSNPIRDFRYNAWKNSAHREFLKAAFSIGMLPEDPEPEIDKYSASRHPDGWVIADFLEGESIKAITLLADNAAHQRFVCWGIKIELLSGAFLDYIEYDDSRMDFSSDDSTSVELLMHDVEQALREAFGLPAIQTGAPAKKNFSQSMGQETVKIIVGEGEGAQTFVLHKDLLMNKVLFFEKMFNSQFVESSTGLATLPEDSPDAFEVLVEWIYCSTLKTLRRANCAELSRADLAILTIGLAEKYMLPDLGNHAMSFLVKVGKNSVPTMSQMSMLYEQTPPASKARIYAARTVAWAMVNPDASGVTSTSIQMACQDSDLLLDAIAEIRGKNGHGHELAHTYPISDYHNHVLENKRPTR